MGKFVFESWTFKASFHTIGWSYRDLATQDYISMLLSGYYFYRLTVLKTKHNKYLKHFISHPLRFSTMRLIYIWFPPSSIEQYQQSLLWPIIFNWSHLKPLTTFIKAIIFKIIYSIRFVLHVNFLLVVTGTKVNRNNYILAVLANQSIINFDLTFIYKVEIFVFSNSHAFFFYFRFKQRLQLSTPF